MKKLCALFAIMACLSASAFAAYPEKAVTLVVPFGAGGGSDVMARSLVAALEAEKALPVPIVIENKPGGSGTVGWSYVAMKHRGDNYTIATTSGSFWNTAIAGQSPVSFRDFVPIAGVAMDPLTLVVNADSPYKTLADLVAACKAAPDKMVFAGTSAYAGDRVCLELLKKATGLNIKHLSFKSGAETTMAVLGNHVAASWANPSEAASMVESKKLRVLATATEERLAELPDVPTFKELGYPEVVYADLRGVVGPKGMSAEAVKVIAEAVKKACASPVWRDKYVKPNMVIGDFIPTEEWTKMVENQHYRFWDIFNGLGMAKCPR